MIIFHFVCSQGSPSKKQKRGTGSVKAKRLFKAQPPPPDEATCEDSTLMDLISMKQPALNTSTGEGTPSSCFSTSLSPSPPSSMSPHRISSINHGKLASASMYQPNMISSPLKSLLPSLSSSFSLLSTPPSVEKKRQRITPAPAITSPAWASSGQSGSVKSARRGLDLGSIEEENLSKEKWHDELCMDWSVKTRLLVKSENQFGWNTALKTSEESSGISAFVRCIDMEPNQNTKSFSSSGSQLDTSLGAQFHQCCLYWQHPYLPTVKMFPRDAASGLPVSLTSSNTTYAGNIKLEDRALDAMFMEWYVFTGCLGH